AAEGCFFFFQAEDGIRDLYVTGVQTCALPISIVPGGLGENLTIAGLDWSAVVPEAILKIGDELILQITRYTSPCVNITRSFLHRSEERRVGKECRSRGPTPRQEKTNGSLPWDR